MPDITMCINNDCEKRKLCYRANATPNPFWQSFSYFPIDVNGNCESFILREVKKDGQDT